MTADRRRFLLVLAGASTYLLSGIALVGIGLWASGTASQQTALTDLLSAQAAFVVLAAGLLILGLGILLRVAWSRTVVPARRLATEVRLLHADPSAARAAAAGPAELRAIADGVNALADRVVAGEREITDRVAVAAASLEQERNRLAALMTQLRVGVLMCTGDGRVSLYNSAAVAVFGGAERVGLGRSVFALIDRSLIAHALDRISAGTTGFHEAMTAQDGKLLRVQVSLVAGEPDSSAGFILLVEDLTRRLEADQRRADSLRSLTEGSRASVASIRAAVENLREYPQMDAGQRDRFIEIISEEILDLSAHVERAVRGYSRPDDSWFLVDMLGGDLLQSLQRALEQETDLNVTVADLPADVWVKVDSHALVRALTSLARQVSGEHASANVALSLWPLHRWAQLDVRWPGAALDASALSEWTGERSAAVSDAEDQSLGSVMDRHGGELWSGTDADGSAYVRLLLPLSEVTTAPPSGSVAPALPATPAYDFELFTRTAPTSALDDRRLDELAYTVFDTETTGLDPQGGDEVISLGAVRIVNGKLLRHETFERLVDPMRPISPAAVQIHGITRGMLDGQPPIEEVLPDFARFAEDTVLVGHNVAFDLAFLQRKEASSGVRLTQPVLDTLLLSAVVHPDHQGHSLEAIAARLGVSVVGRHTALGDAFLTGELFLRMLRLLLDQGVSTLGEAREVSRRTYQARATDNLYSKR